MCIGIIVVIVIVTNRAAKASKPALFIAPAHVAIQTVLHKVGTFKLIARCHGNRSHSNQHRDEWNKRQK